MIFQVEVKDFWIEEGDLIKELVGQVKYDITCQIKKQIQEQIDKILVPSCEKAMVDLIQPAIDAHIRTFITEEGKPVVRKQKGYGTNEVELIPYEDYLRNAFEEGTNWNPQREIKRFAEKFGETLKLQYNAAFANQIVQNLKEQGMLKDEVVNALLSPPGSKK